MLLNAPDLTKQPPRSPRVRLGGYAILPRMLDKGRALLAGQAGEYNFACPLDQQLLQFAGIDPKALKAELQTGKGDEFILDDLESVLKAGHGEDALCGGGDIAEVEYTLNRVRYHFKSILQDNATNNLAAVEQFLHFRVLGIERGIETAEDAFAGYQALPDPNERLKQMSDADLRKELKKIHPDTGNGNKEEWQKVMDEKERREKK
jgi:hypothetical protein